MMNKVTQIGFSASVRFYDSSLHYVRYKFCLLDPGLWHTTAVASDDDDILVWDAPVIDRTYVESPFVLSEAVEAMIILQSSAQALSINRKLLMPKKQKLDGRFGPLLSSN